MIKIKRVFTRHEFVVFKIDTDYLLVNTKKPFSSGHSHLKSFNSCISIIKLIEWQEVPRNHSKYFLTSIIRVCNDKEYKEKLEDFIDEEIESMMVNSLSYF